MEAGSRSDSSTQSSNIDIQGHGNSVVSGVHGITSGSGVVNIGQTFVSGQNTASSTRSTTRTNTTPGGDGLPGESMCHHRWLICGQFRG